MPIEFGMKMRPLTRDEYHSLDYQAMGVAFGVHDCLGGLHDEVIYQNEFARRLRAAGFDAVREFPVRVSFGSFAKTYLMDLVLEQAVVYELKAADDICAQHRNQIFNYLMLTGMSWGKLVNFGGDRVESEYITSQVSPGVRWEHSLDDGDWQECSGRAREFRKLLEALIREWGCFLDIGLYTEAIVHFSGGPEQVYKRVECHAEDGASLGTELMPLLAPHTTFHLSAVKTALPSYERHLARKLSITRLRHMLWVNFANHAVTLKTLSQEPHRPVPHRLVPPPNPKEPSSCPPVVL